MLKSMKLIAAVAVTAGFAFPANALTKVGTLDCDVSAGIGMVVASQKGVKCVFTPTQGQRPEVYLGTISKYGIDVGATNGGKMIWTVFAPTTDRLRGALAGTYAGATAEATVGAGIGANALVGGSNRTITLQPISVQGQTGLNLALGVGGLTLNQVRR